MGKRGSGKLKTSMLSFMNEKVGVEIKIKLVPEAL